MSTGAMAVIAAGIGAVRRKIIGRIPDEYKRQILAEKVYIFNLGGQTWGPIARTHSNMIIPTRGDAAYSVTEVTGRIEYSDAGIEDSVNEQVTTAKEIAEDLCNWCNNDLPRCDVMPNVKPFVGVWWETNPEPTRLIAMVEAKKAYNKALVAQADAFADTEAGRKNINDLMRSAAREMGVKRTWLYEATEMAACPACGSPVLPEVAVCRTCKAVIDEAKARKHFPERFLHRGGSGEAFSSDSEV